MSIKELFRVSLESSDSTNQEIEYAFFIKLDGNALTEIDNKADSIEQQEQWETHSSRPDGKKATIRVRSINDKKYVLCSKLSLPDQLGKQEVELPTTKEMFEHFKVLGNTGTRKKRYNIKAEGGLVWEVDVYENANGELHPWCKVDLEVPDRETEIPEWPFEFNRDEAILNQPLKRTHEENKFLDQLFKEYNLSDYRPL
jgi:CYTH domain-containing protein